MARSSSADSTPRAKQDAGWLAVFVGVVMIVEGVLCALASIPFLVFGGFGLFGLLAGILQCWVGCVLIGWAAANPKGAVVASAVVGIAIGFTAFGVLVFASCDSIVNCGSGSIVPQILVAVIIAAFNLFGAVLLWRRQSQPPG